MFGSKKEKKKKKKLLEKVLMGAVIGAAVGSVVGASIAPQEGKKTRKDISDFAKKVGKSVTENTKKTGIIKKIKSFILGKRKKIPHEAATRGEEKMFPIKEDK